MNDSKHQVVIVGGGTAGITVAAQLHRKNIGKKLDIAIIEPNDKHYYQPLWTLVGGGVYPKSVTEKNETDFIPKSVNWIKDKCRSFIPDHNQIELESGKIITYDYLIVAAGIQCDWDKIEGLQETLGKNGVSSNYSYEHVDYTWQNVKELKKGRAIFTQPPLPIKCAGAPQKAMYLSEDFFRKNGVRENIDVIYCNAGDKIFGVEKYRKSLEKVIQRKEIITHYQHNLIAIDGNKKIATFAKADGSKVEMEFDFIHVVPPQSSPDFIKRSPLADDAGWVAVDKFTTQHIKFPNVFSLGDSSSLPTSKTGAAVRKQAPVLVHNLINFINGKDLDAKYFGYTSCPLVTGYGSLILAEFDYDGKPDETFPFDQAKERRSMYILKKYILPRLYWFGMLRGKA